MADQQLLSDLLHELDGVIGCGTRTWIKDAGVMVRKVPSSFYLSGLTVASAAADAGAAETVWRFTPQGRDGVPHDVRGMFAAGPDPKAPSLAAGPLRFDGADCTLHFAAGALVAVDDASLAPYGVWVAQPANAAVTLDCTGLAPRAWPLAAQGI